MKYIENQKYGEWTFKGEFTLNHPSTCQLCGRGRKHLFRFDLLSNSGELIEWTELGSECIKNFDFNQRNPYTNKSGVNTAL